jgi:4-hydroxy-tetrahydrodipicolinate synthase
MATFEGALTALVTPFRDGAIDEAALRALVDSQIDGGIDGLVPCGTTGECATLDDEEHVHVVRIVVEQTRGRVPVLAGAGTNDTRHSVHLGRAVREVGADGLLLVVPYYNRPSQEGLVQHFRTIVEAVQLPSVLYNIPSRTGIDMSVDTLARLAELDGVVGIKEATGNVLRSTEIANRFGERLTILSGDDALTLPVLAVGGHGVISVASNILPGEVAKLVRSFRSGDIADARAIARRLAPLFQALFLEPNPGPAKAALAMLDVLAPEIRLPLVMPTEATQGRVRSTLNELGLL